MKTRWAVAAALVLCASSWAQDWRMILNYNIAVPGKEMLPYINNTSVLGFSLDARRMVSPHVSVGGSLGQQLFYRQMGAEGPNAAGFLGAQIRFMNAFPLMLNTHVYLGDSAGMRPYAGINVGAFYAWRRAEMGVFVFEGRNWQWGMAPEIGAIFPLGRADLNVAAKMNCIGQPCFSMVNSERNFYMSINVGMVFSAL